MHFFILFLHSSALTLLLLFVSEVKKGVVVIPALNGFCWRYLVHENTFCWLRYRQEMLAFGFVLPKWHLETALKKRH